MTMSEFSRNLINLLYSRGITQRQLAEAIGISEQSVSRYITGNREPSIRIFSDIADFFGVSMDFLIGKNDVDDDEHYIDISDLTGNERECIKMILKCFRNK